LVRARVRLLSTGTWIIGVNRAMPNRCVFCSSELTEATKEQHIIPASVGGTLRTKSVTCSQCNEAFGNTIDPMFAASYQKLLVHLPDELLQGYSSPTLILQNATGERLKILPGGRGEDAEIRKRVEGATIHLRTPNEKVFNKISAQLKGKILFSSFDWDQTVERLLSESDAFTPHHLREAAKILIEAAAFFSPDGLRPHPVNPQLRSFVKSGEHTDQIIHKSAALLKPRARNLVNQRFEEFKAPASMLPHRIWIVSSPRTRSLIGLVAVLGTDIFGIILSENWDGPACEVLYQRSILKGFDPGWHTISGRDDSSMTLAQLQDLKVPGRGPKLGQILEYNVARSYLAIVDFREFNADILLAEDFAFALWEYGPGLLDESAACKVITKKLEWCFKQNQEAWDEVWPRLHAEMRATAAKMRFPEARRWDEQERLDATRVLIVPHYRKYYSLCRSYIGMPGNLVVHSEPVA